MANLDLKSETINKGLDIIADSTKETRNALDSNVSKGINKFFELLKSTPIAIKLDTYIAERPYKLEKAMEEIKSKYGQIPEENQVEPSAYIALQTVNNLNYSLDEDYLRKAFINILISDMDSRKKSRVKPAYIEIVKQISKEDAEFLKLLHTIDSLDGFFPLLQLKWLKDNGSFILAGRKILINPNKEHNIELIDPIVLSNLLRLNLINIPTGIFIKKFENLYKDTFNMLISNNLIDKHIISEMTNMKLDFNQEKLEITPLGKEIIDICLS